MPALAAPPQLIVFEPMNRTIRPLVAADRSGVFRILESAGNFTPAEVGIALELIDEWLELGEHSGYLTYVLEARDPEKSEVLGYVCFGPTPLTESTFDLYWIAVDKSKHRGGVGKRLLKFSEEEVVRRGGKMLLIETSSQETYGGTIQFYERTGYELVGKIPEYYKPGDDKLIFAKRLAQSIPDDRVSSVDASVTKDFVSEATPQQLS
jgi:ribosomal protein S18 acetylase RimI-like enzyme